jgi:hypothetical protein
MAEVEWEHEQYFRQKVIGDSLGPPPPDLTCTSGKEPYSRFL